MAKKPEQIINRFLEVFKILEDAKVFESRTEAAGVLGITPQVMTEILKQRMLPPLDVLQKFFIHYRANANYVFRGEMPKYFDNTIQLVKEPGAGYTKGERGIPYYDMDVAAGNITLFSDHIKEQPLHYLRIPAFADCDLAINIYGDSMYPKYRNGDIIVCKEIHNWKNYVQYGEVYLVATNGKKSDGQRFIKFVRKAERSNYFKMVSENPKYDPFEVAFADIKKMFIVKGKLERNQI
jgi:hypothetical protein